MNEYMSKDLDQRVKKMIRTEYRKTKDVSTIEKAISAKFNIELAEGTVQSYINDFSSASSLQDEKETDSIVDRMLKSIGQSVDGNQKLKSEKENKFIDEDVALKHLLKCQREVEEVT